MNDDNGILDKSTLRELGRALWKERTDKRLYLKNVAVQTNLPERVIEGMEIGKFVRFSALRKLLDFYGKKVNIVLK